MARCEERTRRQQRHDAGASRSPTAGAGTSSTPRGALASAVHAGALAPDDDRRRRRSASELAAGRRARIPTCFIRTGGEQRISNFLLWNLAYTELYFCDTLWPDFDDAALDAALAHFAGRQRRFGLTRRAGQGRWLHAARARHHGVCCSARARHLLVIFLLPHVATVAALALLVVAAAWEWSAFPRFTQRFSQRSFYVAVVAALRRGHVVVRRRARRDRAAASMRRCCGGYSHSSGS